MLIPLSSKTKSGSQKSSTKKNGLSPQKEKKILENLSFLNFPEKLPSRYQDVRSKEFSFSIKRKNVQAENFFKKGSSGKGREST